jgi:NAD(P)-dependent dehydrogenase (short-subunit alcohol dehydrogenase family)
MIMDLQLAGARVLVTGASKGIGLAAVRAFLAEGAEVIAASRRMSAELAATQVRHVPVDLSTIDGPARLLDEVVGRDDRLDVLVNNVGGGDYVDGVLNDPLGGGDEVWASVLALNLDSVVRTTRAALPALLRSRGAIVTVGSDAVYLPHRNPLPYSAAKAAVAAFSRGLAEHVGPAGVRVNVVSPSVTRTGLTAGADGYIAEVAAASGVSHEDFLAGFPARAGLVTGALIEPDEIARAIVLLASPTMPSAVGSHWSVHAGSLKSPF